MRPKWLPERLYRRLDTHDFKVAFVRAHQRVIPLKRAIAALLSTDPWATLGLLGLSNGTEVLHPKPAPAPRVAPNQPIPFSGQMATYNDVVEVVTETPFDEGRATMVVRRPVLNPMRVPIRAVLARRPPPPNCRPERMDLTVPVQALGEEDMELGVRVPTPPDVPEDLRDVWASAPDCSAVFSGRYEGGHTPATPVFRGPFNTVLRDF